MKTKIKYLVWLVVICGLGFAAKTQLDKNKQKLEADAAQSSERNSVIPVKTAKVGTAKLDGNFEMVGSFAPYRHITLMSEVAGSVKNTILENGLYVQAGKIVLTVDNELLDIQLEAADANLAKAKNDLKRLQNLLGDGGVTQQQVDDVQIGIANLAAEIKLKKKQIAMTYVKAPISGTVSNKMVEKGSLVAPSVPIADITNISRLKMQVHLTEEQVVAVKKGSPVQIRADIFPDKILSGKITFIDVTAGASHRYLVEIEIPNSDSKLKAGMTGTAFFTGGRAQEVLAIPRESIVGNLQDASVYLAEGDKAVLRKIVTGQTFGEMVEVKEGLKNGESIIVSGQINLEDGMSVSVAD